MANNKFSFSDRNGRGRGYSSHDLIAIIWDNIQGVIAERGLLDEEYGYIPSQWDPNLGEAGNKLVDGKASFGDSRVWLNRALRARVDFEYNPHNGEFVTDGFTSSHPPIVLDDDMDGMFDFLEALHEVASSPNRTKNKLRHTSFNKKRGQELLRNAINDDLALYTTPYKMLENGQIVALDGGAIGELADEGLKLGESAGVKSSSIDSMHQGIYLFMKRDATLTDKKAALKEVISSLESLRPKVKENLLSDDERDLFNIANNFSIRHQTSKQKSDYDASIWYDWMFQVNLAALIAVIKIIQRQEPKTTNK